MALSVSGLRSLLLTLLALFFGLLLLLLLALFRPLPSGLFFAALDLRLHTLVRYLRPELLAKRFSKLPHGEVLLACDLADSVHLQFHVWVRGRPRLLLL